MDGKRSAISLRKMGISVLTICTEVVDKGFAAKERGERSPAVMYSISWLTDFVAPKAYAAHRSR